MPDHGNLGGCEYLWQRNSSGCLSASQIVSIDVNSHTHSFSLTLIPGLKSSFLIGGWGAEQRASCKDTTSESNAL